jgi:hypothetical protein
MAKKFVNPIGNFIRKDSPHGKRKTLPTWEFFYTGTLWRLTHGQRGKMVNLVPNTVSSTSERH